jgi:hypothetical protein
LPAWLKLIDFLAKMVQTVFYTEMPSRTVYLYSVQFCLHKYGKIQAIRTRIQFGESFLSGFFISKIEGNTVFSTLKYSFWPQNTVVKLENYSFSNGHVGISELVNYLS